MTAGTQDPVRTAGGHAPLVRTDVLVVEPATPVTPVEAAFGAVLAEVLGVDRVPVDAHFFDDLGADSMVLARFCARVRKRGDLPAASMQDVYQHPTVRDLAAALPPVPVAGPPAVADPAVPVEAAFGALLAEVLGVDRVLADAHFFDDLGADSMVLARFCARVRKRGDLPAASMQDVYQHPTVRDLAAALAGPVGEPARAEPATAGQPVPAEVPVPRHSWEIVSCGVLQLLVFLGWTYLAALVAVSGYDWISAASGVVQTYLRTVLVGGAYLIGMCTLPIVVKWVLIGRWRPQQIRVWSPAYVRFWTVKTLIRANPVVTFFAGSPLYVLYLRALGADIGPGVAVFSRQVPVCTDLLTIGAGTVVSKDSQISGYRVHAGVVQTGRVTLGRDVLVSEATVLDIDTVMGDGSQLGHRSSLHAGQAVPAGESWHGSPARRTDVDHRSVDPAPCGPLVRFGYCVRALLTVLLISVPVGTSGVTILFTLFPRVGALLDTGTFALTSATFYLDALGVALVLFLGSLLVRLLFVVSVPRLLGLMVEPDRVYRLYGFHYSVHRTITRTTNVRILMLLTGDSSYVVHYLRALGYDLGRVLQTGSNFGAGVKHESPYLSSVGRGTMVADGLSMMNADYSSTSFRVSRTRIGAHNFLGNAIAYPSRGRTGDDCLLATKVMVPIDGELREGVGLLGSPPFEIPRSVYRDGSFDHPRTEEELAARLVAKDRHNRHTIGLFLLARWASVFGITLITLAGFELHDRFGPLSVAVASLLSLLFTVGWGALVERAATGFRPMTPQSCSIYEPYFWWHERYWKLVANPAVFNGTPFKNVVWRLLGVRLGRRVFDDGAGMPERSLVTIGDDCTLNAGSTIQCHSQEDGAFKLDRIELGSGVTVGVGTWVHYGVTIGDGAVLAPDSFLMKGEEVPPGATWGGNPARDTSAFPLPAPLAAPVPAPVDAGSDPSEDGGSDVGLDVALGPRVAVTDGWHGRHRAHAPAAWHLPALHTTAAAPRHR